MIVVIPDIHTQWRKADSIIKRYEGEDIILLGDTFDDYFDTIKENQDTAEWWMSICYEPYITCLMGNHDLSYLRPASRCGGWNKGKQAGLNAIGYTYSPLVKEYLKFFAYREVAGKKFLFSHAGVHPHYVPKTVLEKGLLIDFLKESEAEALNLIHSEQDTPHWIFHAGLSRGGAYLYGGPVWLDWDEFTPIEGYNQIVGHSRDETVRKKIYTDSENLCIDTSLWHYATIDENGKIEIVPI